MSGPPTTQRDLEGRLGGQFPSRENSLTGLTLRHFKFANTSERKTVAIRWSLATKSYSALLRG